MKTNFEFIAATSSWISSFVSKREHEIKLGEVINTTENITKETRVAILGVCEDIGPQANGGLPNAHRGFDAFLGKFLNMQSNRFLLGNEVVIHGFVKQLAKHENIQESREMIEELDDLVSAKVQEILALGLIPIVIGGGHNNAFPIIRAVYSYLDKPISVLNCDPHADFRVLEGRHSGNPFSYAKSKGYLMSYSVFGLHKQYNSEEMLQRMDKEQVEYRFFEDYLLSERDFKSDVNEFCSMNTSFGLELDMDAIQFMPSSAYTSSGFSIEEMRFLLSYCASNAMIHYLHLPEGAPYDTISSNHVGKGLAYLVSDFVRGVKG